MRITIVAAALAVIAPATAAGAQDPGSRQTREFVQAAGGSDAFETMEAYSAIAQSTDPQVVAFARRMIRDHRAMRRSLAEATSRAGLSGPPDTIGAAQSPLLAALQSARGVEFDTLYWRQQVLAHCSALTVAQDYAATGDAPSIRKAAADAIPVIRAHLAMAEQADAKTR